MTPKASTQRLIHANDDASIATSRVVTTVFDAILEAIHQGQLQPGQRISDNSLAAELGVSRTPVREALQRLREIGLVEASASRFTRVAVVSPRQTAEAMVVWVALYGALVEEVIPTVPISVHTAMTEANKAFRLGVAALDMQAIATSNFTFFSRLTALSQNQALRRSIVSVVHLIRLGSLYLPAYIDFAALDAAQVLLLKAVERRDVALANDALSMLRGIRIPLDTVP